jgi:hypothetical protein
VSSVSARRDAGPQADGIDSTKPSCRIFSGCGSFLLIGTLSCSATKTLHRA